MKKYIAIFMSILVMMVLIFTVPAEVVAETTTVMTDFYSRNEEYEFVEVPYTLTIEDNGKVSFISDFWFNKDGEFEFPEIIIKDIKGIIYPQYYTYSPHAMWHSGVNGSFHYESEGDYLDLPDIYTDSQGRTFYKENHEKVYFTDTIIVEFNGITITKEIGNGDSPQITTQDSVFGDIDGDGLINANDASLILSYSTYRGVGGSLSFKEWLAQ